jgi:hypothetical protein
MYLNPSSALQLIFWLSRFTEKKPLARLRENVRAKTSWLEIRIMCPSGPTCLPADCCFSVGLVQRGHHYHLINM